MKKYKKKIVLDIETTGINSILDKNVKKHRIIEIGAVEIINRKLTNKKFHCYLNPKREIEEKAFKIHGISNDFLLDKPFFSDISEKFINFIKDSDLIIHNASFDINFLEYELSIMKNKINKINKICNVIDTLIIARNLYPGKKNTLDILCKRYKIKNFNRNFHSAILDAKILSELYIRMTRKQKKINFFVEKKKYDLPKKYKKKFLKNILKLANKSEILLHEKYLKKIKKNKKFL
ncbi:DNA polymerase III subunit epsilon [Buchnera aphidicola (Pseudoregma panicola)]|uniref:DNA polymerase III subunit epsilon n=1 Tax=Buchnera aphidicola TaxID=9 RepID=UPI0031B723D6